MKKASDTKNFLHRILLSSLGIYGLAATLVLGLQACGGESSSSGGDDDKDTGVAYENGETSADAAEEEGGEDAMLSMTVMDEAVAGQKGKEETGENTPKTWKRADKTVNDVTIFVGEEEQLELRGKQIAVKIDGFRARVLMDCFFQSDLEWQTEGSFKLRLPNGASPYYFAFGESVYLDSTADYPEELPMVDYKGKPTQLDPDKIKSMRRDSWSQPRVARVVPKEKAAFAYGETVRRQIDPLLAEWAGADVFNCSVFPIMPGKLHRVVVGYDVNLTNIKNDWVYELDLPSDGPTTILDLDIAQIPGVSLDVSQRQGLTASGGRTHIHVDEPNYEHISVRYRNLAPYLLQDTQGIGHFSAVVKPTLPILPAQNMSNKAVLGVDVSLSSNPDKFNVWVKMVEALLRNNRQHVKEFAVLFFNVEAFWWQEGFVANNEENVVKLLDYINQISLVGATDVGLALNELASPDWSTGTQQHNIFLLSDGSPTWGANEPHAITANAANATPAFIFNTGMSGTDLNLLNHIARESGGALFSVSGEDEVRAASTAFRRIPWQIEDITLDGAEDLLIAGRPKYVYPGQKLQIAGRGTPTGNLSLDVSSDGQSKNVQVAMNRSQSSDLANRSYGQLAVAQLEEFGIDLEPYAASYGMEYQVAGKTCSFLMLESEEDYEMYGAVEGDEEFVVEYTEAGELMSELLHELGASLGDPKRGFEQWVTKLTKLDGFEFAPSPAFDMLVRRLDKRAFTVHSKGLKCDRRSRFDLAPELKTRLGKRELNYDMITKVANSWHDNLGPDAALKMLSSLIEKRPGDGVMIRDVAYSASAWGLHEQAYFLFKRSLDSRPHEPQNYHAVARTLSEMGKDELALLYFEIAMTGQWDSRFGDFKEIVAMDYIDHLRKMKKSGGMISKFVNKRYSKLVDQYATDAADIMITITWNTDNTDIDLHVVDPSGEECFYENPDTKIGGHLTRDVTQGYGPEMYMLKQSVEGEYIVKANYFSSNANKASTRTKVSVTIYENWGKSDEKITRKTVTLKDNKEMQRIITLRV